MPTSIDTSTWQSVLNWPGQRKFDRCQNGNSVIAVCDSSGSNGPLYVSTNDGATWTKTANFFDGFNGSLFIDLDDCLHWAFKGSDNKIYYRRATPNAGRTAWSWGSAFLVYNTTTINLPDLIVHREGTGWKVHIVTSQVTTQCYCNYVRLDVSSSGTVTQDIQTDIGPGYAGITYDTFPTIDFHHTGDGKTVAGSTPHIYVAWSVAGFSSGQGIRYRKAVYSSGPTWTWNTEREIDSAKSVYADSTPGQWAWLNCLYDGNQVMIGGQLRYSGGSNWGVFLWERDEADTTTTVRGNISPFSSTNGYLDTGAMTYNARRDICLWGGQEKGTGLVYYKYDRGANTFTGPISSSACTTSPASAADMANVVLKRGFSNSKLEWIYKDGVSPTWTIKYDYILNVLTSRTYKWNVIQTITLNRIYKWNVRVSVTPFTRTYKWNVRIGINFTRTYKWNVIFTLLFTRVYKWNVRVAVPIFTRTFKWNVRVLVPVIVRTFLWDVFAPWTKIPTQVDIWTPVNENDAAWSPVDVESTSWR